MPPVLVLSSLISSAAIELKVAEDEAVADSEAEADSVAVALDDELLDALDEELAIELPDELGDEVTVNDSVTTGLCVGLNMVVSILVSELAAFADAETETDDERCADVDPHLLENGETEVDEEAALVMFKKMLEGTVKVAICPFAVMDGMTPVQSTAPVEVSRTETFAALRRFAQQSDRE
jgi:hypothetical protein